MIKIILEIISKLLSLYEKHSEKKEIKDMYELEIKKNMIKAKELIQDSLEKSKLQKNRDKNRKGYDK